MGGKKFQNVTVWQTFRDNPKVFDLQILILCLQILTNTY